jgi:hypothetical protein
MSTTMNLRSGRAVMRRESRNYEEFNERKKYQEEQRLAEESLYDDDEDDETQGLSGTEIKFVQFKNRLKFLVHLNEHQKKNNYSFKEKVEIVKELYELVRYNIDVIIHMYLSVFKNDKRLPRVIIDRGRFIVQEMCEKKRTRGEDKLYKECRELILFVIDILEYHIFTLQK